MKATARSQQGWPSLSRADRKPHLVIVTGCQRSGTSMVGQIIGAHPHALLIDEDEGLMRWAKALLAGDRSHRRRFPGLIRRAAKKYSAEHPTLADGRFKTPRLHPDITHLVLKAPNLTYDHREIARLEQPVSIVHPVRDPRAVAASIATLRRVDILSNQLRLLKAQPDRAARYAPQIALLDHPGTPLHVKRAILWQIKSTAFDQFAEAGLSPLVIQYEKCVADPEDYARKLADHVGLPFAEEMTDHAARLHGSGPGMLDRDRPVDRKSLHKWQYVLAPDQERDILETVGASMKLLGYGPKPLPRISVRPERIETGQLHSPVIVTGRGGSGTRLISNMVGDCGVFRGKQLNISEDSMEWVVPIYEIAIAQQLEQGESTAERSSFLQSVADRILSESSVSAERLWGFKLPESMLIMPHLLAAFPNAKVIHLVRHPVTSSLRRTHLTSRPDNPIGRAVCAAAYRQSGRDRVNIDRDPDWMRNAITWNYQVGPVASLGRTLSPDRYLELKFEDLCADPHKTAAQVRHFLGSPTDEVSTVKIGKLRSRSWRRILPHKQAVWDMCEPTARMLGYEPV